MAAFQKYTDHMGAPCLHWVPREFPGKSPGKSVLLSLGDFGVLSGLGTITCPIETFSGWSSQQILFSIHRFNQEAVLEGKIHV